MGLVLKTLKSPKSNNWINPVRTNEQSKDSLLTQMSFDDLKDVMASTFSLVKIFKTINIL